MGRSSRPRRPSIRAGLAGALRRAAVVTAIETLEQRRMLSAGDLDMSFGSGGIFVDAQPGSDFGEGMAIQSDGKILTIGTNEGAGVLARYTTGGAVDMGFGSGGRVDLGAIGFDDAIAVAAAPGNKIVVVGTNFASFGGDFVIARFNSNGTFDTSFNSGAVRFANSGVAHSDTAAAVVVRTDGTIVVAGTTDNGNSTDFAVLQLDSAGANDNTFSGDGWAFANFGTTISLNGTADQAHAIALQSNGFVVVAGETANPANASQDFALARFNLSGVLDGTFGTGGMVTTDFGSTGERINSIALGSGGAIYFSGFFNGSGGFYTGAVGRYNSNGTFDSSFGGGAHGGLVYIDSTEDAFGIAVDSGGDVLAAAVKSDFTASLSRLHSDGVPDASFSGSGEVVTPVGGFAFPTAVAVQNDGKVVVFGTSDDDFMLLRYGQTATPAPVANAGVDQNVNEGQLVNFSAAASTGSNITFAWDLDNDGQFDDASGPGASRTFGDNGNFTVRVQVTDDQNQSAISSLIVHVANVTPTPGAIGGPSSGTTNQILNFTGSFTDPGFLDTHQVSWDFGDGNVIALHPSTDPGALTPSHAYTSGGPFTVTFGVRDDDNATVFTQTKIVTITPPAPVADAGADQNVNEGQLVNFSAAASTGSALSYAWDLDGDGQFDDATGVAASWTYPDNGNVTVSVKITDSATQTSTDSLIVHVANVAPNVANIVGSTTGVRQLGMNFTGSFTDPGTADTHQVSWNFGDGNVVAFHATTDSGALVPTHAYTSSGTFLVSYTIKDDDGAQVTKSMSVTISALGLVSGNLVVGGTDGNDTIVVKDKVNGTFKVMIGGVLAGQFTDSQIGKIILYGGDGDDDLTIEHDITKDSEMYGGNGADVLKGGGGADVMFGGAGDDKLKARDANDILIGGDGADTLAGGDGRDILIGGLGADKIAGQDDSDILVAGNTSNDTNVAALVAIRNEWATANANAVTHIRNGSGGLNGSYRLASGITVFDDGVKDTLAGGSGQDWFIATLSGTGVLDKVTGLNSADFADDLSFILSD